MKLYLTFDLLEPATRVAIEYIDSVMGHGKEICGIKVLNSCTIRTIIIYLLVE